MIKLILHSAFHLKASYTGSQHTAEMHPSLGRGQQLTKKTNPTVRGGQILAKDIKAKKHLRRFTVHTKQIGLCFFKVSSKRKAHEL